MCTDTLALQPGGRGLTREEGVIINALVWPTLAKWRERRKERSAFPKTLGKATDQR